MAPDRTTATERLITRVGMWGALRGTVPLLAAVFTSILLFEALVPSAARLFPDAPRTILHVFAIGIGLLLGLVAHFTAAWWDRRVFDAWYGLRGRWLTAAAPPLGVFPPGDSLRRARLLAERALELRPDRTLDHEAVRAARRQLERWERIERPLLLAQCVRAFLSPGLAVGLVAVAAGLAAAPLRPAETARLLALGVACLLSTALLLAPYARLRADYFCRLYDEVAAHARRKRSGRHRPEG